MLRDEATDYDPVWLPDGESLMVPYGVEIPLDGSTPRKLPWANRHEGEATYSPDGSRVAYTTSTPLEGLVLRFGEHQGGRSSLPRPMVLTHRRCSGIGSGSPYGRLTGDRIAFTSGNGTELRVVDVATGTVTSLCGGKTGETVKISFLRSRTEHPTDLTL
jgi:hypothetical protein